MEFEIKQKDVLNGCDMAGSYVFPYLFIDRQKSRRSFPKKELAEKLYFRLVTA